MTSRHTINTKLLESKMVLKGFNRSSLAQELGVSRDTIANLLSKKTSPNYKLIIAISETLKLESKEAMDIFFALDLHIA